MNPSPRARRHAHQRGIALVLTLAILALVTLLVIGFLTSARVENMAARNFNDNLRARQLSRAALDEAVTVLRQNTPIVDSSHFYVTRPGQAGLKNPGIGTNQLYSYPVSGSPQNVNLNDSYHGYAYIQHTPSLRSVFPGVTNFNSYFTDVTGSIFVPWVYIGTNGQEVAYNSGQTLAGRYVWYVDDEACKINLNSAYKTDTNADLTGPVTPEQVDIRGLFNMIQWSNRVSQAGTVLDKIRAYALSPGFTTRSEWPVAVNPPLGGGTFDAYYYVDFVPSELTVWGADPTITPWGQDRLNLNAVGSGPTAVTNIANMLSNSGMGAWFTDSGGVGISFANKYPSVQQIAANIVDFIDNDGFPTSWPTNWDDTTPPVYLGLEQTPYLNDLVISNIFTVVTNNSGTVGLDVSLTTTINVELWNMYAGTWTPPPATEVYLMSLPSITWSQIHSSVDSGGSFPLNSATLSASSTMSADSYTPVLSFTNGPLKWTTLATNGDFYIQLQPGTVTAIYRVKNNPTWARIDYAQIPVALYQYSTNLSKGLPGGISTNLNWITSCNDPRVKPVSINWNPVTTSLIGTLGDCNKGTLNRQVVTTNAVAPTVGIRADGDASSHITTKRDNGTLYSVGELGYIHTGVPWRTLRLQPLPAAEAATVPDWAVLDLFSTTSGSVTGRVNLNGRHLDETTDPWGYWVKNLGHFRALNGALFAFTNANISGPLTNIAISIVRTNWTKTAWRNSTSHQNNFIGGMYNWIGEVCEVTNVADYAVDSSGVTTNDAWAEMRIRRLANLVTTRSTAFKVVVVAQTLVDVNRDGQYIPADGDLIRGEDKLMAVVERYEQSGKIGFRIKHLRHLDD